MLIWSLIVYRLFFLQVIKYPYYQNLAKKQQGFTQILEPKRGDIYFKSKEGNLVKAATTKVGALVYLNMKNLKDPEMVYSKLNAITPLDRVTFNKLIAKINDPYEILKHKISRDEAEKIAILSLPGVGLEEERWRFYPADNLASHVLGFVAPTESEHSMEGQYGVEELYDTALRGASGKIAADKDANGLLIALSAQFKEEAKEGEDIILTLEPTLQKNVEIELLKLLGKWKAKSGGVIIIDPKTGKIRALAAYPNFHPGEYQKTENLGTFLNPFNEKIFELGSVFKPLTMAAAIDAGVLGPKTTYIDKGEIRIADRTIKNFDGKARGLRTMTQVLEESLNTGAVFAMQQLGGEKLKDYFYKFGLAEKSNIELPGEVSGDLSNLDSGREVEFATASFGQGIAVTPIEFTMALASLSNGGMLVQPSILEESSVKTVRRVIKPESSETITKMLVEVVDNSLAGGKAKLAHYSIAAKTGTAQMANQNGAGYSDQFLHSFFGYFPAYDPKFLIFMFLEKPQGVKYASQSMTDSFSALVEFLINYYTILPDR